MSTRRPLRQSLLTLLALALAWAPAATLLFPDRLPELDPVVVTAQDRPLAELPPAAPEPAEREA